LRPIGKWMVAASLLLAVSGNLLASDWPQFRGPNADGFTPETALNLDWNTKPPKTLWTYNLTDGGYATLSAADGKVFVLDHHGSRDIVRAINLTTGKDAWTYSYDEITKKDYGYARCTPVFDNGKLYTLSAGCIITCLNAGTGQMIWAKELQKEVHAKLPLHNVTMCPIIDGDKLIVCTGGDASMVALDKLTGKLVFTGGGKDDPSYDTPVIATINDIRQYVYLTTAGLQGVSPEDGKLLWKAPWKTGWDCNAAAPIVIGNSVFITSGNDHGCALVDVNGNTTSFKYQSKEMQSHYASPLLFGGKIYGTTDPKGELICLDPLTGKALWREKGFEKGSMIGIGHVMLAVCGATGDVVMVELTPAGYHELGRIKPLPGKNNWVPPIIADGKLLVRNQAMLACVDLK